MKTILVLFSLVVVFTSCETSRYAYSPTAHNVPILTKQGDSKVAANYSTNGIVSESDNTSDQYERNISYGFDMQGALAVTNHIALQANYFYRNEKTHSNSDYYNFSNSSVKYQRNMFEFGGGFFTALDRKKRILLQTYAGAGFGKTNITEHGTDQNQLPYGRYYDANLTKYFLEPSMTFRVKEAFAASFGSRISLIKFRNINTDYSFPEKQDFNLDSLDRFAVFFFEPVFVGSFGFNKLPGFRIELQVGASILLDEEFIDYRPVNFSLGLSFDIGKLIRGNAGKSGN